ncbi:hypothetical protein [Chelatococcus sp. XZ-Ab1]|uniref:portal protein n=1 Tax=Chelatococcus sp. XZ-Ab1 TaxID=3034027 RepID=UPI0023E421D2|nr:hypothetical protein [Chelatococcus sp. XZ-Ab1]
MFDLSTEGTTKRKSASLDQNGRALAEMRPKTGNALDTGAMQALHRRLMGYYLRELDRQGLNRAQMALDQDFYDGLQWSEADAAELEGRGQKPLVYNVIATTVDWVIGTEKRARTDFKVLPRRKDDAKPAERKTQILKYLSDCNRTPFHVSRAFEDAIKVGVGWMEDGVQGDDEEEPLYSRYESWRNVLHDSAATEPDLYDGRYVIRTKWADLDVASAMFPKRRAVIRKAAERADEFRGLSLYGDEAMDDPEFSLDNVGRFGPEDLDAAYRERVRLIEIWFRMPVKTQKIAGGSFAGEVFDPQSPGHIEETESGVAEIAEKVTMRVHVAIMTTSGLLYLGPSPYRHNRFPLTPIWAYRRGRDNLPYGMIRRLRDIQEDINKRASKALYILSTNKMLVEEGAADDLDELVEEAQRPDGVMVVKAGKLGAVRIDVERELPQYHLELMSRSIAMIQQASGVTDELLGRRTNASSGKAIISRQDQGAMATAGLFDNLRFAQQVRGEKILVNVEQFMTEEKAFRITNMRGTPEYITVNDGLPENDIVRTKADFVISESDWRATIRQAAVDELLDLMSKLAPTAPALVMAMLDLVVENMDVPSREELVKRIRAITGQSDPDADEPSPEMQQKQQAEAMAQQLQMETAIASLQKVKAEAERTLAQAEKLRADLVGANVGSQQKALAAAREAIAVPASADVADHILAESGFKAQSDKDAMAAAAEAAAAQQTEQPPPPAPGGVEPQQAGGLP